MTSTIRGNDGFDSAQYVNLLNTYAGRNKIINGHFRIWQRGSSQTSSGYGSDDRWHNFNVGSTKTVSRQTFVLGQTDVPGNPEYYSRTVVSSVTGASNYCQKSQSIEDVTDLAGEIVTLSFWAKADSNKNMSVEVTQSFGGGGSPSAIVTGTGIEKFALTSQWQKFTHTFTLPSIAGKVLGTDGNDYQRIVFWFDAGSSFDSRTDSLGHQSGTFDISQVQLEIGTEATPFEERTFGQELALCQRYYEKSFDPGTSPANGPDATNFYTGTGLFSFVSANFGASGGTIQFKVAKRGIPAMILYGNSSGQARYQIPSDASTNLWSVAAAQFVSTGLNSVGIIQQVIASTLITVQMHWTADSEIN